MMLTAASVLELRYNTLQANRYSRLNVNWGHWATRGMSFIHLPGNSLTQPNFALRNLGAPFTLDGYFKQPAQFAAGMANSSSRGSLSTASNKFQLSATTTIMACWFHDTALFASDNLNRFLFGVGFNASASDPAFNMQKFSDNNWYIGWFQSGGIGDHRIQAGAGNAGMIPNNGALNIIGTTSLINGSTFLWMNGSKQAQSSSSPTTLPSTANDMFVFGGVPHAVADAAFCQDGVQTLVWGGIWDRIVPDVEMNYIGSNPMCFFTTGTVYDNHLSTTSGAAKGRSFATIIG